MAVTPNYWEGSFRRYSLAQGVFRIGRSNDEYEIKDTSSICLSEGFALKYNEEVKFAGWLTRESKGRLINNYDALTTESREQSWEYR